MSAELPATLSVMQEALQLTEEFGKPIFPCRPDKKPYTSHGFQDAATNIEQIAAWWERWPDALIGVPSGRASKLLVVDVDPAGADWYAQHADRLNCRRIHKTRRGRHLLYRMPAMDVRNSASQIAPGVDVRAEGGYIIWWPAHGFEHVGSMDDLTEVPDWLLALLVTKKPKLKEPAKDASNATIKVGRNDFLSREAFRMKKKGATEEQIHAVLIAMNQAQCEPPLDADEVAKIAKGKAIIASEAPEVSLVTLSTIQAQPLRPLWPGKLWRGKSAIMAGDPGLGKSLSTLDIAARITRGALWPASEDRAPLGDVILLSAEDDAADTLRPRLESAGADLTRIHIITDVTEPDPKTGQPKRRTFSLSRDLAQLERIFEQRKPVLFVIDPITAYLSSDTDSHNTADVRAELAPLADLAQRYGVAVLMVSHLNKTTTMQAIYRVTGSVAFVAAARSAFGVLRDPNDRDRRFFLPLKNNLGKDKGGLAYRVVFDGRAPRVEWEPEPVEVDIDEVTVGARTAAKKSALDEVSDWLRDQLRHGPVAASTLWRRAKDAGHAEKRVRTALKAIGAESGPMGFAGAWHYRLPESAEIPGTEKRPSLADSDGDLPTLEHSAQASESAGVGKIGQVSDTKVCPENRPTLDGQCS